MFLLHSSKNTKRTDFQYFKTLMTDLVVNADIDSGNVRVAVVMYRKRSKVFFQLDTHTTKEDVLNAINKLKNWRAKQASAAEALKTSLRDVLHTSNGGRDDAPNVVVVMTTGKSAVNQEYITTAARKLKDAGAKIFAIGCGKVLKKELSLMEAGGVRLHITSQYIL